MENTLQKYLQQVENQLNEISKGIPLPEVFKNELDTISNLNKQDKIDDVQYVVKTLKDLFQSIANKWRPPLTVKFQENYIQSMIQLNQAISSLRSEEIPIPELKKESTEGLQKYTDAVYNTIQDKITFFTNIKIAEDIVPKRDTEHIVHTITSISNFINSQSKNFKDYREDIAQSLLLVLTISNKMKYEEHAKLESNSIQLVSLQTSEFDIPILCFDISYHLHEMLTQLNPRSAKSKESIEKLLLESYLDPKKMNILETEYYTLVYSKMQKIKSIVFDNVRNSIRGCFHGQGTIVTINYDSAIDVLKSSLPEQISIREVAKELPKEFSRSSLSIYDTQEQPNIDKNINQHLYYCENTGLWYLTKNGYQIKIEEPETIDYHFKKLEVINEINLPKIDQGKAQNYIHVPLVGEMMRNISDSSIEPDLKFNEVGYLFNSRYERSNLNLYTEKKIEKDYKYLTLKINDFSFENGPLENTIGMLYVLDSTKKMPITEPIFFIIKDGKPIFNDSNITKVIFTLNDSKTLILVCRLFHDQAYDLTSFLSSLSNGKKILKNTSSPYNFAACGISLYDNKGNFNNVTSFPQHFYVIQPGTALIVDTALLTVLSQPPSFKLLIKSSIELKLEDKIIDNNYCYTWNYLGNSQTLISSNTELTSTTLTPIIELNNIQFTFKKAQTGKYVYFKAYLVENDSNIKDPQGLPNILTYTSNKLSNVYVSSVVPFTTRCQFPDFVRFHINKKLKKSTHIIIQFFSVTPGQSPELYKLSIIPFYDNKTPIRSSQMEVTLFQLNQSPMTNYLAKAKKLNAKSKTIFNIIVPPIYFPHQNLRKLLSSKISLNLKEIVTNDIPKNLIDESFLYTFSRLLMITSNTNVQALVVYLSKFSYDEVNPLINTCHNLMPLYKILIDRLRLFITSFCISSDFARLCEERLDAAKIIYDSMCVIRGTNKSPELKVQMMLRIADQFYGYPTIRLKWLQKIVEVNVCEKLMAQASIAELQVTFLLDFMMRLHSNEHHIQPLDFSFCNNSKTETLIDINHCPETMRSELTKHQLFCAEGIINSINKAIQYATEAKLNWAIKIYYLLLIQIHESQRNYLELSDLVHKLSDNYYVINELFEKPLQPQLYFYLLERRRNNECIQIEVFSSTISDLNDYASYLNNKETKRFEYLGPAFTASNHEEASTTTNGICVSILKPLNNPLFSFDNNTFYQDIIYHNDDYVNGIKMKRIIFTTDKALPNSSICANVINIATQNYGHFETFKLVVQNSMDELKKCSDAILSMIPTNENIDRYTKNKPLFPLQPCRCTIRYELKKKSPALSAILEKFRNIDENPESVSPSEKEIAVNWIQQIMNTIQALKKGIDEVQGQERLSQEYMKLRDKASKYSYILFNEDLKFVEPKKKVDPMEYVSPYEDATSF
ncbi:hypothetical protein GPJ56_006457 [Histomonas meleagridis]|uniref:uncharacterized protein n=1 Tax=Histomonas meleagridis TaxID=135588 RepID=UPI003559E0C9|nr:hypothetical protein GPJ56_006457 [Histomonas meleagridis]KAH0796726.1 hypothetical protein GO595_010619 [Histomonas meleagridis]